MLPRLNHWLADQIAVEIPLDLGVDLQDERFAQAIAVDRASALLLCRKATPEDFLDMIEPIFGSSIDAYLEEIARNLDG